MRVGTNGKLFLWLFDAIERERDSNLLTRVVAEPVFFRVWGGGNGAVEAVLLWHGWVSRQVASKTSTLDLEISAKVILLYFKFNNSSFCLETLVRIIADSLDFR